MTGLTLVMGALGVFPFFLSCYIPTFLSLFSGAMDGMRLLCIISSHLLHSHDMATSEFKAKVWARWQRTAAVGRRSKLLSAR